MIETDRSAVFGLKSYNQQGFDSVLFMVRKWSKSLLILKKIELQLTKSN